MSMVAFFVAMARGVSTNACTTDGVRKCTFGNAWSAKNPMHCNLWKALIVTSNNAGLDTLRLCRPMPMMVNWRLSVVPVDEKR